jgi:CheY-like chemotaxis protein
MRLALVEVSRLENIVKQMSSTDTRSLTRDHLDQELACWKPVYRRPRVVVVEDEPVTKRIAARALRTWGYDTEAATSAEEAWPLLTADGRPLIAILDWVLPDEDGLSLCRRLRAAASSRPVYVLLMTARHEADDEARALEAGADSHLAKPLDLAELKDRVGIAEEMLYIECAVSQ